MAAISRDRAHLLVAASVIPLVTMLAFAILYRSIPMFIASGVDIAAVVAGMIYGLRLQIANPPSVVRAARKEGATVTEHYEGVHAFSLKTYKTSDICHGDEVTWKIQQTMTEPTEWVNMATDSGKPVGAVHLHDGEVQATLQIKAPLVALLGEETEEYIHMY